MIILGQRLRIYRDHNNLNCKKSNTEGVLRWRLILGEYGPDMWMTPLGVGLI